MLKDATRSVKRRLMPISHFAAHPSPFLGAGYAATAEPTVDATPPPEFFPIAAGTGFLPAFDDEPALAALRAPFVGHRIDCVPLLAEGLTPSARRADRDQRFPPED